VTILSEQIDASLPPSSKDPRLPFHVIISKKFKTTIKVPKSSYSITALCVSIMW